MHGPVSATINAPTAVALTWLDAAAVAAPAFPIATIGLVGFTILGLWWRKRGRTLAS